MYVLQHITSYHRGGVSRLEARALAPAVKIATYYLSIDRMGTHDGSATQGRKHNIPLLRFRAAHELASCGDRNPRRPLEAAETRPNESTNRAGGDGRENRNGTAGMPGTPKQRQARAGTGGQTHTDCRRLPGGDRPADRPADGSPVATDPPTDPERKHE